MTQISEAPQAGSKPRETNERLLDGMNMKDPAEVGLAYLFFVTDEFIYSADPRSIRDMAMGFIREIFNVIGDSDGLKHDDPSAAIASARRRKLSAIAGRAADAIECSTAVDADGSALTRFRLFERAVSDAIARAR